MAVIPGKKSPAENPPAAAREDGLSFDADPVMQAVEGLAGLSGQPSEEFLDQCVRLLAGAYHADHAFVASVDDGPGNRVNALATWAHGRAAGLFSYQLSGSPCLDVLTRGRLFIPAAASSAYPQCEWLSRSGIDSYYGVALTSGSGQKKGVVVVAGCRSPVEEPRLLSVLPLFARRITQQLEQEDIRRELALEASVFARSPQGIMISDAQRRILRVNTAFTEITGWQEADVLGRGENMLSAGRDDPELHAEIQQALESGGIWIGELWSRRHDGEVYPENRTVVAVRREDGGLQHYVSTFSDVSAEKFAAQRIHRLAHYDATTELPNRVLLQDRLLNAINRAERVGERLALLFLDLDGFKQINDTYGHNAGDEVLRLVGIRLTSRLRKADIVARVGGDEFAIVLGDVGRGNDVQTLCDQLMQVVTRPYDLSGQEGRVTTSIGIAMYPEDGSDVQTLLKHADAAMYRAKESGKNRYTFYEPAMNQRAEERMQLTQQLRRALDREEFSLCYQPQYDLGSGRLAGVEALVRWHAGDGTLVPPSRFIPVAEDSGLIVPLGNWILNAACKQAQQWHQQGLEFGRLSVNVSGRQFSEEGLKEAVSAALFTSGLPGERLELEISESWVMEGPYRAEQQMRLLHELGVNFVIDNFGIAHSSMAYLKRFPVQKLKIDQSFIRDVLADPDDAAIVSAIIAMGHSLGLRVVAEGVETSEQSAFLRGTGCDEAQGFLFGRPVPHDEMNVQLLYSPTPTVS